MISIDEIQHNFLDLQSIVPINQISGQKDVYRALMNGTSVALKLIKPSVDPARVEREIIAVSKLTSSNVPRILLHGTKTIAGQQHVFIIEDFIEGNSYREILIICPTQPLNKVLDLAKTLLEACIDFETHQLVHRDIKPENLMIDAIGKVWVIDFGLARHLDMISLTPTLQGFGFGTLGYAPPEQFRNLKPEIDTRADLFSVGIVLYESLNGSNPYRRPPNDPLTIIRRMESSDLQPLQIAADNNKELSLFLQSLTSRYPSRRPQTAVDALTWFNSLSIHSKGA